MSDSSPAAPPVATSAARDLFVLSFVILFLELACIRWFPAHVLFLTFFTNVVLLACFLGMSLGCLSARRSWHAITWTPMLLVVSLAIGQLFEKLRDRLPRLIDLGQSAPELVFFGSEYATDDVTRFILPMEAVCGLFFLLLALVLVGPGQELGRAFDRMPHRVAAYAINILGSLVGVIAFGVCSWLETPPWVWFGVAAAGMLPYLGPWRNRTATAHRLLLAAAVVLSGLSAIGGSGTEQRWSPYYRIDYLPATKQIWVNLLGHQFMVGNAEPYPAYALPHLLQRDSGGAPFREVLIIGAGSGNDVSRALEWGASHIDAVEIDPAIQRLGHTYHPSQPYQDPRVTVHLDDGRNFLRATSKQYDLIIYALVDSLVLHSSHSNIRLESYLFTKQAFQDVHKRLKPGGSFIMYNFFRQGWIVGRIEQTLRAVFGQAPIVLTQPHHDTIVAETPFQNDGFAIFLVGNTDRLRAAFAAQPNYWLRGKTVANAATPNGFQTQPPPGEEASWWRFSPARLEMPTLQPATDEWPFLYLREPMVPELSLRGAAVMGALALALLLAFHYLGGRPTGEPVPLAWGLNLRMLLLGAGFMLIETKAVVHLALLFGSTWMVNAVVFAAVLVMILAANLFVIWFRPRRLLPYYVGLLASLALNIMVPLDALLGMERWLQVVAVGLLVFAPIAFAGVIFAVSFAQTRAPDVALGWNVGGAMLGGLLEYLSMALGFQLLLLVAVGLYALSAPAPLLDRPAAAG